MFGKKNKIQICDKKVFESFCIANNLLQIYINQISKLQKFVVLDSRRNPIIRKKIHSRKTQDQIFRRKVENENVLDGERL